MTESSTNAWPEIKEGLGSVFKILGYTALTFAVIFGAAYVYVYCYV